MNATAPTDTQATELLIPVDDGATAHLPGMRLPDLALSSTSGTLINLAQLAGRWVIYVYPKTGRPGVPPPAGWDLIPGARGCTPQACGFRDHYSELHALNTQVVGLSAQSSAEQKEARDRLQLPFELLSDTDGLLHHTLGLPMFETAGLKLYKRLALIADDGLIRTVFYPVFPPETNAADVIAWLNANP